MCSSDLGGGDDDDDAGGGKGVEVSGVVWL